MFKMSFYKRLKRYFFKRCYLCKDAIIVPDTPRIIKRSVKFGCQICHNIIISSKMKCKHRFCELCVITKVLPFTPFNISNANYSYMNNYL